MFFFVYMFFEFGLKGRLIRRVSFKLKDMSFGGMFLYSTSCLSTSVVLLLKLPYLPRNSKEPHTPIRSKFFPNSDYCH